MIRVRTGADSKAPAPPKRIKAMETVRSEVMPYRRRLPNSMDERRHQRMQYIYVLSASGKPLMPTTRTGHVRRLLNTGKARIASHVPFVIQLKYKTQDICQPLYGGTDPGRDNIGEAVVRGDGTCVYRAHLETRNREVPKLMEKRRAHRHASRRGERLVRKRRAGRYGTLLAAPLKRKLPGYKDGFVTVKDIINTEAKFNNRVRPEGWLTPTARQLVRTHINMVRKICQILPVTYWSLEINKFAFMRMDNGQCYGADFQNGRMKGYSSVNDYVDARQNGRCYFCGRPVEGHHHILPKHVAGSNLPENIIGVCKECHRKIHTGELTVDAAGIRKKYGALSVLNQAAPYIAKALIQEFGSVGTCFGWQTKDFRERYLPGKDHDIDAMAIAMTGAGIMPKASPGGFLPEKYEVMQFRRHDRALIRSQRERTYYLDGKAICKNRHKRFEQKEPSLEEYARQHQEEVPHLTVKASARRYNNPGRMMPGTVFLHGGSRYVMTGQLSKGRYFRAYGQGEKNFPVSECTIVKQNGGIVYV